MAKDTSKQFPENKHPQSSSELAQKNTAGLASPLLQREEEEAPSPSLWLITFTDIMALMLTFFVLMYSMASPKEEEWEKMTSALNQGLSKFYTANWQGGPQDTISIDRLDLREALNLNYLKSLVEEAMAEDDQFKDISLILKKDTLIISMPDESLFAQDQPGFNEEGKKRLLSLATILERIRNRVEIVGRGNSSWGESLERAMTVSQGMAEQGYSRPVIIRGRYDVSQPGAGERIEIVIMKDDGYSRSILNWGGSG